VKVFSVPIRTLGTLLDHLAAIMKGGLLSRGIFDKSNKLQTKLTV